MPNAQRVPAREDLLARALTDLRLAREAIARADAAILVLVAPPSSSSSPPSSAAPARSVPPYPVRRQLRERTLAMGRPRRRASKPQPAAPQIDSVPPCERHRFGNPQATCTCPAVRS